MGVGRLPDEGIGAVSGILREPVALALLAAMAGVLCTAIVRALAPRLGMVSYPNPIVPQHTRPVAYLGGLGVAGGMAAALWTSWMAGGLPGAGGLPWPALFVGGAGFLLVGLVDDARPFSPGAKLAWQGIAAALAVATGLRLFAFPPPAADMVLTALWLVLMVNAVNVTDVCDGLVAGIAAVTLGVVGAFVPALQGMAAVGVGACIGFLWFNRPPASIYLGDAGSHLLGFLLAVVIARGAWDPEPATMLAAMLLLAGVVLFEVALLVTARRRRGIPWWRGSPDHFALRLQAAGWSRARTAAAGWSASLLLGLAAFTLPRLGPITLGAGMAGTAVAVAILVRLLLPSEASVAVRE